MKDTIRPGTVAWTGDNPFVYLKTPGEDDWSALALYFRIALSPLGPGQAMLLVQPPHLAQGGRPLCFTDNAPMAAYLLQHFAAQFGLFRPYASQLQEAQLCEGSRFDSAGSNHALHQQTAHHSASGRHMAMRWTGLQTPFMVDVPRDKTQTGAHEMFTVFQPAAAAELHLDGQRLPGATVERDFFGTRAQSASLAFSETWLEVLPPAAP
jgi:hypothetical protein